MVTWYNNRIFAMNIIEAVISRVFLARFIILINIFKTVVFFYIYIYISQIKVLKLKTKIPCCLNSSNSNRNTIQGGKIDTLQ